jgi:hypothetical protein
MPIESPPRFCARSVSDRAPIDPLGRVWLFWHNGTGLPVQVRMLREPSADSMICVKPVRSVARM